MRSLNKNKQNMYFSIPDKEVEVYKLDENGDKIVDYVDDDGTVYYVMNGTKEVVYTEPQVLKGNINGKITQNLAKEFGIENLPNYAVLLVSKGAYKLIVGGVIWKNAKPTYKDFNGEQVVDISSSKYNIVAVNSESLNEDVYLLHKVV